MNDKTNKKHRRDIIGGIIIVSLLMILLVVQIARFFNFYWDALNSPYGQFALAIVIIGLIIVTIYVLYHK
ncbi:MAG: hypothetical protein QXN93_04730 [Methanomassiliicoccales archaeon]